jgi:hypothetical protein
MPILHYILFFAGFLVFYKYLQMCFLCKKCRYIPQVVHYSHFMHKRLAYMLFIALKFCKNSSTPLSSVLFLLTILYFSRLAWTDTAKQLNGFVQIICFYIFKLKGSL